MLSRDKRKPQYLWHQTIACKLYNDETTLSEAQKGHIQSTYRYLLGRLAQREVTLSNFVQSRGNSHKWSHSFLHKLCRRMDIEDCDLRQTRALGCGCAELGNGQHEIQGCAWLAIMGKQWSSFSLDAENEVVDDNWSLETLYQEKIRHDKNAHVIKWKARHYFKDAADGLVEHICRRGFVYGLDDEVVSHRTRTNANESLQQEEEMEVIKCLPAKEKPWEYTRILTVKAVADLTGVVKTVSPKEISRVTRTKSCLFGSKNFFATIETQHLVIGMNTFLRVIDVALMFENGQVLLVSECEADHILELLWSSLHQLEKRSFCFLNLVFTWQKAGRDTKFHDVSLPLGCHLNRTLPPVSRMHQSCRSNMMADEENSTMQNTFCKPGSRRCCSRFESSRAMNSLR
ncbi:hypothetical protein PsorP6_004381 [Peronosclerospora sorghi]|uniref:Uncharacterized protein n=1 Tax=Peronosclerospora sorghi TaxID=230839 RepID=A0ACC0VKL7_9STRA|nr:hypothetical protein PsorP6_004381 [Peronosclerospora sorghi]